MPMSILECASSPLEATQEELEKVAELKVLLKEHLVNTSMNELVRQAMATYIGDHQFLIKYIRGRKLNIKKALHSIISYAEVKHIKNPEIFPVKLPPVINYALECGVITVLNQRDSLGRTVVACFASLWDESKVTSDELICTGRYIADLLMNNPDFLKTGVVLTIDCKGLSLSHMRQITLPVTIRFINVFWQAYPILIKGMYMVNLPMIAVPLSRLLKPFFPSKLKERLVIESGVSELHKRITPRILPSKLGGELSFEKARSDAIINYFSDLSNYELGS